MFICLRPPIPSPPPPPCYTHEYILILTGRGGGGFMWTSEKVSASSREGSKIPTWLTVSPVYKLYNAPVKATFRAWCLCWSMVGAQLWLVRTAKENCCLLSWKSCFVLSLLVSNLSRLVHLKAREYPYFAMCRAFYSELYCPRCLGLVVLLQSVVSNSGPLKI